MFLNNLTKRWKLGLGIGLISFAGAFTLTSSLMTVPGMGLESLKFINSVDKQIDVIFPKGKYVLDGKSMAYEMVANNALKASFTADAISTLNFRLDNALEQKIKNEMFAEDWWNNHWKTKIDNHEDIDLNDIGKNMIEFDKAVATKFHSFGYVNSGTQWLFNKAGLSEMFSSIIRNQVVEQQSIWNQSVYESTLSWQPTGLNEFKVLNSNGGNVVNNKVWFLNQQIDGLKLLVTLNHLDLGGIMSKQTKEINLDLGVLKDKTLTAKDIAEKITADDLYHPNFSLALGTLKTGVVMSFAAIPIALVGVSLGVYLIILLKKENGRG